MQVSFVSLEAGQDLSSEWLLSEVSTIDIIMKHTKYFWSLVQMCTAYLRKMDSRASSERKWLGANGLKMELHSMVCVEDNDLESP